MQVSFLTLYIASFTRSPCFSTVGGGSIRISNMVDDDDVEEEDLRLLCGGYGTVKAVKITAQNPASADVPRRPKARRSVSE